MLCFDNLYFMRTHYWDTVISLLRQYVLHNLSWRQLRTEHEWSLPLFCLPNWVLTLLT
jgi:hypothetical protein